jgi:hypothetical protein
MTLPGIWINLGPMPLTRQRSSVAVERLQHLASCCWSKWVAVVMNSLRSMGIHERSASER